MGLFDKGKEEVIESLRRMATELRDENARLTRELETYRREHGGMAKLKEIAERLTEDNKALLEKVENFSETERQLKQMIEERNLEVSRLQNIIQQKKDEIALKTFAIVARDSDINLSDDLVLTGGLKTSRNVNLGDGVIVKGSVEAGEVANLGNKNVIYGDIVASTLKSKAECEFRGSVKGKEAYLGDRNVFDSPVSVEEKLEFGNFCEVKEDVYSKGDIIVGSDGVLQKVMCDGSLKIGARTTVQRIVSKGVVELGRLPP
jgi:UDP-3-O-[3-hydroxymyristoyl] glucosamine N-acyltransferase